MQHGFFFDQALLLEGVPLKDPATFVQRLNRVLNQSILTEAGGHV